MDSNQSWWPPRIRPVPRQLPQGPEGGREPRLWPGDARGTVEQPEPEVPVSPCSTRATRLGDPRSLVPWRSIGTFKNLVGFFIQKMKTLQFGFLTRDEELYEKGGGAFFLCCCAFPKKILRTLMARGLLCVIARLEGFNIMGISTASAFSFFGRKWCSSCRNLESKSNRSKRCQWRKTRFFDWVWYSYGTHNIIAFFPASFQDEMQNIRGCKVWERGRGKHVLFSYTSCKTEIHLLSQKTRFGVFLRRLLVQNPCRSRWLFFWIMEQWWVGLRVTPRG